MAIGEIEELEVLDEHGKGTGVFVDRKLAHKLGIPHAHLAVIIFDIDSGKLLIQQRSKKVEKYPGLFDLLSGHIKKGNNEQSTMVAECKEEAGLDINSEDEVIKVASVPRDDVTNNGTFFEKGTTELYILLKDLSHYKPKHDDEVEYLGLMDVDNFKTLLEENKVVPRPGVWKAALESIKQLGTRSTPGLEN